MPQSSFDVRLPPCACRCTISGAQVFIIGTAHISSRSAADVEDLITLVRPDCVVVELSRDRISSLYLAPAAGSSLRIDVRETQEGFPELSKTELLTCSTARDSLIVRGPAYGEVDIVPLCPPQARGEGNWWAGALRKHCQSLTQEGFLRAQGTLYMSIGAASRTGSEFVAASHCAEQLGCSIILGDVEGRDLFDPFGALHVTRDVPFLTRFVGPCIRPEGEGTGIDLIEALKHIFGGSGDTAIGHRILYLYAVLTALGLTLDGLFDPAPANPSMLASVWAASAALGMCNILFAAVVTFLLTAVRDERLSRAVAEAAQSAAKRHGGGGGRVVLVCGVAHVNGVARHLAKAAEAAESETET